jgi:serine/threonine protein kinase
MIEDEDISKQVEQAIPDRIGSYRVLRELGHGGMGTVFLAMDEALGRQVAIKVLGQQDRNNSKLQVRFMQEARALARLSHSNIVHIYSLGSSEAEPYFVMEYVEGVSLTEAAQVLPIQQKVVLMAKVARATDFLHQHNIIHRDLKPSNVLVGPDLEPKLLDFGLARALDGDGQRVTQSGEFIGTPEYFSPEHTKAGVQLDARSDVFSLGTIFYELLTGTLPFQGDTVSDQSYSICNSDPVLPRRISPSVPGELQKICMKALEKEPSDRYGSAREMADDMERFLSGEPVLALPSSYAKIMTGKIEDHLRDLEAWKTDHIISEHEFDSFRKKYDNLVDREDAWIMQMRRLSLGQVSLYLGAWILVIGSALIFLFAYQHLRGIQAVLVVAGATAATCYIGLRCWREDQLRLGVAYLLAFCLLLPITFLVVMGQAHLFTGLSKNRKELEFFFQFEDFQPITNAQLWWAILFSLPAYLWLRRFTKSSVFSLVSAFMLAIFSQVTLLRIGMLDWFNNNDPGNYYFHLIPVAILFFAAAIGLETLHLSGDSKYFYPLAVVFTFITLSGLAGQHKPYADRLNTLMPWTRGQVEYLFIINAGIYFVLQGLCDRLNTSQMRTVAKAFRFVIPGHVLTSVLLLGLDASDRWHSSPHSDSMRWEARIFEAVLPILASAFVLLSIPKQMKNFLATGLIFLAVGIIRLEQDWFHDHASWPLALLMIGILLMLTAINYPLSTAAFSRWIRLKSRI